VAADVVRAVGDLDTDFSGLSFVSTAPAMSATTTTRPTIKGTNFRQPVAGGLS
jgi:hypothetical protein